MPKQYLYSSSLFFNTTLALLPAKRDEILAFWQGKLADVKIDLAAFQNREPMAYRAESLPTGKGGSIALLPLYGVISQRMNMMSEMSGGTSTDMFAAAMRQAVADPDVRAVVIDVDSPGGTTYGMTELADILYSLRGQKPIIAQVNSLMASAAYWIGSQADEIVVTPGGELGHIGVSALHLDRSQEVENAGIKPYVITAGKFKHEQSVGSDLMPPTDEALTHMQASVDEAYERFVDSVARGRGVKVDDVRNGYGEGRVLGAKEAVKVGMADRIGTLEQTLQRVADGRSRKAISKQTVTAVTSSVALRVPNGDPEPIFTSHSGIPVLDESDAPLEASIQEDLPKEEIESTTEDDNSENEQLEQQRRLMSLQRWRHQQAEAERVRLSSGG